MVRASYFATMQDKDAKKRYRKNLDITGGIDPYETKKKECKNDVDLWISITHINLAMYLLVNPSLHRVMMFQTTKVRTAIESFPLFG